MATPPSRIRAKLLYGIAKPQKEGHEKASFVLGNWYDNGEGVSVDKSEAIVWYRKAADHAQQKKVYSVYEKAVKALDALEEAND